MSPMSLTILFTIFASQTFAQSTNRPGSNHGLVSKFPSFGIQCITTIQQFYPCPPMDLTCQCSPPFRSLTVACQTLTCSSADYTKSQHLLHKLCSPLYHPQPYSYAPNPIDPTAVANAIASATSAAAQAISTAHPGDYKTYPPCATNCVTKALETNVCASFTDAKCVCQNPEYLQTLGVCENTECEPQDLQTAAFLAVKYCNGPGVGGVGDEETQSKALEAVFGDRK